MKVAFATCAEMPDGDADDRGLAGLMGAEFVAWDDPAADWSSFDLVVIRSTWDYQRRRDAFLDWARSVRNLVNPAEVVEWNTDKRYLGELAAAGLPVVSTRFFAPGERVALPQDGEYVVKPTVSAGSRDTARFGPGEDDRAAGLAREIQAAGKTVMVQPYVTSVDKRGETAVMAFGGVVSHAITKGPLLKPGAAPTKDLFASEEVAARDPTPGERDVAAALLGWVAQRFGRLPYARIDLVEDDAGRAQLLELELTEPSLFFEHAPGSAERLAAVLRTAS